jgi:acyl-CoA-binding protein
MTEDLDQRFRQAAEDVKKLDSRPGEKDLLELYALYKQGSEGDVSGAKPGFFDFVARSKFEAWEAVRGTSRADAQERYIAKVRALGA